jgi:hypothetical protein
MTEKQKEACSNCGENLVDGECTNPACEKSPDYGEDWEVDEDWEEDEDGGMGEGSHPSHSA